MSWMTWNETLTNKTKKSQNGISKYGVLVINEEIFMVQM